MRHEEDQGPRDTGMDGDGVVDLDGRDLLAAAIDDLLEAAGQEKAPIRVEAAQIAGPEPIVEKRPHAWPRGRFRRRKTPSARA